MAMNAMNANENTAPRNASWLRPLAVAALLFALFLLRGVAYELPPVRAASAETQFNTVRAVDRLARVLGDERPHPLDTADNDAVRDRILAEATGLGYAPRVMDDWSCNSAGSRMVCGRVRNILFEAGPASGPALVLSSHYDSVFAAPGAADAGIGVAVWLEVAELLRAAPPQRRVVFLITDGEEAGLLGARAFVAKNAYDIDVDRIINLEARGVRGPALMFETSRPNAGPVADWAKHVSRPGANSLMAAVYEQMPNSTDLTPMMAGGLSGLNIAITQGVEFYHSARDNLETLDRRSVQHMGDQAWGAVRAWLERDEAGPVAGETVYADIANRFLIAMPQSVALALLAAAAVAALWFAAARQGRLDVKAAAAAPFALAMAGAVSAVVQLVISSVRGAHDYWSAYPLAMGVLAFVLALGSLLVARVTLASKSSSAALEAWGWVWFLAIGFGSSLFMPGVSILFVLPGLVWSAAILARVLLPRTALAGSLIAALSLVVLFVPLLHLLEFTLGYGVMAIFSVVMVMAFMPLLGLFGDAPPRWPTIGATVAALAAAFAAALFVPAYSIRAPQTINVYAHLNADTGAGHVFLAQPKQILPASMNAAMSGAEPFQMPGASMIPGLPASIAVEPATLTLVSTAPAENGGRTLSFSIASGGASLLRVRIPADAGALSASLNGVPVTLTAGSPATIDCYGRSCDGATLQVTVSGSTPTGWLVQGYHRSLPAEAVPVIESRPPEAVAGFTGDSTMVTRAQAF